MPIFKALELPIVHMKSTDAEILSRYVVIALDPKRPEEETGRRRPEGGNLIVDPIGDYGWTINLAQLQSSGDGEKSNFVQSLAEEGFSEAFIEALEYAAAQELDAIRFDRDLIELEPGLTAFDWENDDAALDPEETDDFRM